MLAQAGNFNWELLIPILFIIIAVVNSLWKAITGGAQQQNRPPQRGERPLPPPGQKPQPAQPGPQTVQEKLNAEIEEFLRRANDRRSEKNRRAGQPAQQQPKQQAQQPNVQGKSKQEPSEKKRRQQRESVSQSVEEHLGSRSFESREQNLAGDVARSELAMSQHVQHAFDHQLGSLGANTRSDDPSLGDETKATQTAEQRAEALAVAGLLVNQENLRRAVILREILERPVDRW